MKIFLNKILITIILFIMYISNVTAPTDGVNKTFVIRQLIYEYDGAIYNAVKKQCDKTPNITGSGYKINPIKASEERILAVSIDLLYDPYRRKLAENLGYIKDKNDKNFLGKLKYGDIVFVESPKDSLGNYIYPNLNGWWHVEDAKNPRYINSNIKLDFLQTIGDGSLYNNDPTWNGKFNNVKIYKIIYCDRP